MGNVTAAKPKIGGAVYVAPIGTTPPTDATTALAAAFKALGYISEDGLTNSNSPSTEKIKAWGGDTVLNISQEKEDTFSFKLIESLNLDVLKLVYGDSNITGTLSTGLTVKANNGVMASHVFAVEIVLDATTIKRIVIPAADITEIGDIVYADAEAVGYDITLTAKPDSNGNTHYEYIKQTTPS